MTKPKPTAVLISDIHFTPATLELATESLMQAISKAKELKVPLVIAGDTLDSKAIIRAEVSNRLVDIFGRERQSFLEQVFMLVGNHDMMNEKGEGHSLNFLRDYVNIVQNPVFVEEVWATLIPYQASADALQAILDRTPKGGLIIMHQGVQTAFMGHYVQDKTSLPKEAFADFRVISGHYHRAQDIKCGRPRKGAVGLLSYIGNPYSLTFGEAADGPKGFQVLYDDGLMEQVPTNLRKHIVFETDVSNWWEIGKQDPRDLLWIKITGPASELSSLNKQSVAAVVGHSNFKLDKLPLDRALSEEARPKDATEANTLDRLIDQLAEAPGQKSSLKKLWRDILK